MTRRKSEHDITAGGASATSRRAFARQAIAAASGIAAAGTVGTHRTAAAVASGCTTAVMRRDAARMFQGSCDSSFLAAAPDADGFAWSRSTTRRCSFRKTET